MTQAGSASAKKQRRSIRWVPVAEQHRPGAAERGEDESQLANFAGAYQLAGLLVLRLPAPVVMDHQRDAGPLAGRDHPIGIGQGSCDGLFAQDALGAGFDSIDGHLGVHVVGGGDAEDVDPLFREHLTVVGVDVDIGKRCAEISPEALKQVRHQVADGDKLGLGKKGIVFDVRRGYELPQDRDLAAVWPRCFRSHAFRLSPFDRFSSVSSDHQPLCRHPAVRLRCV